MCLVSHNRRSLPRSRTSSAPEDAADWRSSSHPRLRCPDRTTGATQSQDRARMLPEGGRRASCGELWGSEDVDERDSATQDGDGDWVVYELHCEGWSFVSIAEIFICDIDWRDGILRGNRVRAVMTRSALCLSSILSAMNSSDSRGRHGEKLSHLQTPHIAQARREPCTETPTSIPPVS